MRRHASFAGFVAAIVISAGSAPCRPQASETAKPSAQPRVYLNIIARDKNRGVPTAGLTANDVQIQEQKTVLTPVSFAQGQEASARSLAIWFFVQCPESGFSASWISNGSLFMKDKIDLLTPALNKLAERDLVGVAHWCDDGSYDLDLRPTADRQLPGQTLKSILDRPLVHADTTPGERGLFRVVTSALATTSRTHPDAMPVLIFLYGDVSGLFHENADPLLNRLLECGAMVYGLNNGAISIQQSPITSINIQMHVVHFFAEKTGGEVVSTFHGKYGEELAKIIEQLHGRYEVALQPKSADGAQHLVNIRLTDEARKRYKAIDLRFSAAYLPAVPNQSNVLTSSQASAAVAEAMRSAKLYDEVVFDAAGKWLPAAADNAQAAAAPSAMFRVYADPRCFTWSDSESGSSRTEVTLAIGAISKTGAVINAQLKTFEVNSEVAAGKQKGVMLSQAFEVPADAVRLRFILRDSATGKMGSFELPTKNLSPPR